MALISMTATDWLSLMTHFLSLSLLAIGGVISTVPEMQRFLVTQQHWLSDAQFNTALALGQAAPGPNVLFIALLGWNIGMNAAGGLGAGWSAWPPALLGLLLAMAGILLPSSLLTLVITRWMHQNRERPAIRAFKQGMAPVVIALLLATAWILSRSHAQLPTSSRLWLLSLLTTLLVWRTKIPILWLLGLGTFLGYQGWV